MKILQITPQFPFPLDSGGKIGIYNITKVLKSNGADIDLVAISRFQVPEEHLNELSKISNPYVIFEPNQNSILRAFWNFSLSKPALPNKFLSKNVFSKLEKIIKTEKYDIIHIDHTSLMKIGMWLKDKIGKPLGLRLHNIEWIIWYRYFLDERRFSPRWFFYKKQYGLLRDFERLAISNADISFACSKEDKNRALELVPNAKIEVVSPGVDLDYWICKSEFERSPKEIVFATTFSWKANVDGLLWFLDYVLPLIRKEHPDFVITIIGRNPPKNLRKYPNVNVVGWVERVQPFYNHANLSICPLFVGGGVRVKILEAMSMELPVVSTSIGAEGIDANSEEGLLIADEPQSFAKFVNNLLSDFNFSRQLGKNARKYISEKHSSKITFKKIFDYYSLFSTQT